jgi:ADP-dependent NAD(P)H-hydrate dehydratase / NAD(P)H-hydrate epimerase
MSGTPTSGAGDHDAGEHDAAPWNALSACTAEEALAMDAWLVEERGLPLAQLMAVAGARVAQAAREMLREHGLTRAVFLVGPGNNGGDALVAERLLRAETDTLLWRPLPRSAAAQALSDEAAALAVSPDAPGAAATGAKATVAEPTRAEATDAAAIGAAATPGAAPAGGTTSPRVTSAAPPLDARTLLVDGLFGVGLRRALHGASRAAVDHVNASEATVLAIDMPSGLHATTGEVRAGQPATAGSGGRGARGAAIRADVTLALVMPRRGYFLASGPALVGAWRVADLGFPPRLAHEWLARRRAAER